MDKMRLMRHIDAFAGKKVLVVGDLVLDQYVVGRASRLSREAPIPIIEFDRQFSVPGAAANPANNIQSLGAQAYAVGVVGRDDAGEELRRHLQGTGIDVGGMVIDPSRPTTTKTRVVAEDGTRIRQQVARIDRLDRRRLDRTVARKVLSYLESTIPEVDACLISDYRSGLVDGDLVKAVLRMATRHGKLTTADSQGDLFKFKRFSLVKCNQQEAEFRLGCSLGEEASFEPAARDLLRKLRVESVVITRGGNGMSVARGDVYAHIPVANKSEVFDVTGAGDTVIAVLTLALVAGATLLEAAHLSNFAAGMVVRKLGNAVSTASELREAIRGLRPAPLSYDEEQD
ncbi:MAG: hypothetical protein HY675_00735 [Chloroflexi bacterium]|nr:hypothetical protein [Chloroflexota bacterium]